MKTIQVDNIPKKIIANNTKKSRLLAKPIIVGSVVTTK